MNTSTHSTIRHTVFFKLKHSKGSAEETLFFEKASELAHIPGVMHFTKLIEVSPKNNFSFGFYMEFASQKAYDGYNRHDVHTKFVEEVWMKEVEEFQEIDYVL